MPDAHANFAYGLVAASPYPPATGTQLSLQPGQGLLFPVPPFNCVVWPWLSIPTASTAEIVRVTAIAGDTFTLLRTQEASNPRNILVGDQFSAAITKKTLTDIEASVAGGNTISANAPSGNGAFPGQLWFQVNNATGAIVGTWYWNNNLAQWIVFTFAI